MWGVVHQAWPKDAQGWEWQRPALVLLASGRPMAPAHSLLALTKLRTGESVPFATLFALCSCMHKYAHMSASYASYGGLATFFLARLPASTALSTAVTALSACLARDSGFYAQCAFTAFTGAQGCRPRVFE